MAGRWSGCAALRTMTLRPRSGPGWAFASQACALASRQPICVCCRFNIRGASVLTYSTHSCPTLRCRRCCRLRRRTPRCRCLAHRPASARAAAAPAPAARRRLAAARCHRRRPAAGIPGTLAGCHLAPQSATGRPQCPCCGPWWLFVCVCLGGRAPQGWVRCRYGTSPMQAAHRGTTGHRSAAPSTCHSPRAPHAGWPHSASSLAGPAPALRATTIPPRRRACLPPLPPHLWNL